MEFSIKIPPDEDGYTGRECPSCQSYFKIKFGTGIQEPVPCQCPYCVHTAPQEEFCTKAQMDYIESVALNKVSKTLLRDLKKIERRPDPRAFISFGIQVKGRPIPIKYYREKELEQEVECEHCSLEYTIYGVFGYCPDCGIHNSLQIAKANFSLIDKMIALSENADEDVRVKMIENALEDLVSTFDGFGRETCKVTSAKAAEPKKAKNISFQNIQKARQRVLDLFHSDFTQGLNSDEWEVVVRSFSKRHVFAHKLGVIDESYVEVTDSPGSLIGKKVTLDISEIKKTSELLGKICVDLFDQLHNSAEFS